MHKLDSLPRAESAQRRFAIIKLQKDFDRIRPIVQTVVREAAQLRVGKNTTADAKGTKNREEVDKKSSGHQFVQVQALVERDVDDLILEEREQDILRLNRDVALVNEMFK